MNAKTRDALAALPLLPATGVGSFPKMNHWNSWDESKNAMSGFIAKQLDMGYDIIVDGEFTTDDMETVYVRAQGLPTRWQRSNGNRFYEKGIIDRRLQVTEPFRRKVFEFAQSRSPKPVKVTETSPVTQTNWNWIKGVDYTRDTLSEDWAKAVNSNFKAAKKAGALFYQADEPGWFEYIWEDDIPKESIGREFDGVDGYRICHICYSEYDKKYDLLKELPVHQLDLETAYHLDVGDKSAFMRLQKDDPLCEYKDVALGVVEVPAYTAVETKDAVKRRIRKGIEAFGHRGDYLHKIWIKPDCGYRTTKDPAKAYAKMQVMMDALSEVRAELEGQGYQVHRG